MYINLCICSCVRMYLFIFRFFFAETFYEGACSVFGDDGDVCRELQKPHVSDTNILMRTGQFERKWGVLVARGLLTQSALETDRYTNRLIGIPMDWSVDQ